jgi:beta-phosphoglucomutase-like phosphatase (HAD superfamily)
MMLKALIFDVDGTLADTEEAHRCAFNESFAGHGLDWHWDKPLYAELLLTTGGKERIAAYVSKLDLPAPRRAEIHAQIPALHAAKTKRYMQIIESGGIPLRDGVERLLHEARAAGVALGIATTTSMPNIVALLETTLGADALTWFQAISAGDDVPNKKPAPDVYLDVLRKLAARAGDCVALEDSANGLRAAKAAGLFTIITPSYWTRAEDFSAADLLLPSLDSSARPLPHRPAMLEAGVVLGIKDIEARLIAAKMSA